VDTGLGPGKGTPTADQVEGRVGKLPAIAISESAVDAEQDHGLEWLLGRVDHPANFVCHEELLALLDLVWS
jgi:hypothetical protein